MSWWWCSQEKQMYYKDHRVSELIQIHREKQVWGRKEAVVGDSLLPLEDLVPGPLVDVIFQNCFVRSTSPFFITDPLCKATVHVRPVLRFAVIQSKLGVKYGAVNPLWQSRFRASPSESQPKTIIILDIIAPSYVTLLDLSKATVQSTFGVTNCCAPRVSTWIRPRELELGCCCEDLYSSPVSHFVIEGFPSIPTCNKASIQNGIPDLWMRTMP